MKHYHCKDCGEPFRAYVIQYELQQIEDVVLGEHDHGMMWYQCRKCYFAWLLKKTAENVKK